MQATPLAHTNVCHTMQEQQQHHESVSLALTAAQEEAQQQRSVKQQAEAAQRELAALNSAHEALQSELAVARGRLSGFDESCQLSLDRVQSLSASLQEAQQAKVVPSLTAPSQLHHAGANAGCILPFMSNAKEAVIDSMPKLSVG